MSAQDRPRRSAPRRKRLTRPPDAGPAITPAQEENLRDLLEKLRAAADQLRATIAECVDLRRRSQKLREWDEQ